MSYYLEDHPNVGVPQYGWPRTRVSGVIGVHTTESGVYLQGADPGAENTAGYLSRRTNHGSYHIMSDWDTIIPLVRPSFAAWADTTNNAHALSVSGAMNAARWRDLSPERAANIVRNMGIAAAVLVRDAIAHGVLDEIVPARRITAAEAIAGTKAGFYGHGETNPGTRYDPGQNFDWDLFLATYAAAVGGTITYQSISTSEEDDVANTDMSLQENTQQVLKNNKVVKGELSVAEALGQILDQVRGIPGQVLFENRVDGRNIVDSQRQSLFNDATILAAIGNIKPGSISAEDLAAAIPEDLAKQVADLLAARLAS